MEADWSVALAAGDPVITVPWAAPGDDVNQCRFVDLRRSPHWIDEIEEARAKPRLRSALLLLNGAASQFWTAKCDTWSSSAVEGDEAFDPYEMDAEPQETAFGTGSYIDLLPRDAALLSSFECQERWMRAVVERLRVITGKSGPSGISTPPRGSRGCFGLWSDMVRRGLWRDRGACRAEMGRSDGSRPGGDHGGSPVASPRRGWRYNGEDGRVAQLDRAPAF